MRSGWEAIGAVVLLACWGQAALADDQDPCSGAQNQMQLTRCWSKAADDAERRMGEAFGAAAAQLRERGAGAAADLLQQAQDKWQAYRDAHCAAVAKLYEGGSIEAMQRASCRVRLAGQRTKELDAVITDWGGRPSKAPAKR